MPLKRKPLGGRVKITMNRMILFLALVWACQTSSTRTPWTGSTLRDSVAGCYSIALDGISGHRLPTRLALFEQNLRTSLDTAGRDLRRSKVAYSIAFELLKPDTVQITFWRPTHNIVFHVIAWRHGFEGIAIEHSDLGDTHQGAVRGVRISCDGLLHDAAT
jgi:hypothetical protein